MAPRAKSVMLIQLKSEELWRPRSGVGASLMDRRQAIRAVDPLKAPRRRIGVWLTHRRLGVRLTDRRLAPARGRRANGQHQSRYLNISFRLGAPRSRGRPPGHQGCGSAESATTADRRLAYASASWRLAHGSASGSRQRTPVNGQHRSRYLNISSRLGRPRSRESPPGSNFNYRLCSGSHSEAPGDAASSGILDFGQTPIREPDADA